MLPFTNTPRTYIVSTGSMEPIIPTGSIILSKPIKKSEIKKGAIIAFKSPENPKNIILHRIYSIEKENPYVLKTKGDHNNAPDNWEVQESSVIGSYVLTIPLLGHAAAFMKKPLGFIIMIGIPALLIILFQLVSIKKGIEEEVEKRIKNTLIDTDKKDKQSIHIKILIGFLLIGIPTTLFLSSSVIHAAYQDTVSVSEISLSVKDFVPPNKPTNLHWNNPDISCGGVTNSYTITADWDDGVDGGGSGIDRYEYNIIYPKVGGGTGNWTTTVIPSQYSGVFNADNGVHTYKIRVWDKAGNVSEWSDPCTISYDSTIPTASLSVTGSWIKEVKEAIGNGGFENGLNNWKTAGDVATLSSDVVDGSTITPTNGTGMARIGNDGLTGNFTWENRLMQSFATGAKSLSLSYNFFTRDTLLDDPGFFIKLNGNDIFHQSSWMTDPVSGSDTLYSTGWQQFTYDLSPLSQVTHPYTALQLSSGNIGDTDNQSWVYVDAITTYFVAAPSHATYTLSGSDSGSGIKTFFYKIDTASDYTEYSVPFSIPDNGPHTLHYYSEDNAGNHSGIYTTQIITDATGPSAPDDFAVQSVTENNVTLTWTAPGDDGVVGRAASYDLRYSTNPITDENFDQATKSGTLSSPTIAGSPEYAFIEGLNPGTPYFFALKVFDEAPNESPMVVTSASTLAGPTDNPGDIVINELMWETSRGTDDAWLELRNMTDRTIDLSDWKLKEYVDPVTDADMYTIPTGTTISPRGFLVISTLSAADSNVKNTTIVAPALTLNTTNLRISLTDASDMLIDTAWDGTGAPSSYIQPGTYYSSMERTEVPGNGENPIHWYPCIDQASTTEFFDGIGGMDFGTPGSANRSENAPLVYDFLKRATDSASPKEPTLTLTYDTGKHIISFTASNIQKFITLNWELSYETDKGSQGAIGKAELTGQPVYQKDSILLGTCSAGGTCVYHQEIKSIYIIVTLSDPDNNEIILEQKLGTIPSLRQPNFLASQGQALRS
ncbi:MAG: signal peptidase I [Candidatus Gracilibacteria bacterium]